MRKLALIVGLMGLVAFAGAYAADDGSNAPPPAARPPRPMNLVSPRVLDSLVLTSDEKTKYDALDASFRKDLADLRAKGAERQQFRDLRTSYLDKFKATLTEDQKSELQKALE